MFVAMNAVSSCILGHSCNHIFKKNIFLVRNISLQPLLIASFSCKHSFTKYPLQKQKPFVTIQKSNFSEKGSIVPKTTKDNSEVSTSIKETVKETTKTTFNSLVIIAGIGITVLLFSAVFRELFSSNSPNTVYSKAFDRCSQDPRIQDSLGEPIKGHGETTRRGRRRHVSHITFMQDNVEHMRMKFYLKGARKSASVHLEVIEGANGNYQYRYLMVQMDDWPHKVIFLEDNRHDRTTSSGAVKTPLDLDSSETFKLS